MSLSNMANTRHIALAGLGGSLVAQVITNFCGGANLSSNGVFDMGNAFLIGMTVLDWVTARYKEYAMGKLPVPTVQVPTATSTVPAPTTTPRPTEPEPSK